jgi:hypothetical protein
LHQDATCTCVRRGPERLEDHRLGQSRVVGDLTGTGCAAQVASKGVQRASDREVCHLDGPGRSYEPAVIPEVALQLTHDARQRVGRELRAPAEVEPPQGSHEGQEHDLTRSSIDSPRREKRLAS